MNFYEVFDMSDHDSVHDTSSIGEPEQSFGICGDATKARFFAAIIDNILSLICSYFVAISLEMFGPMVQGFAMIVAYWTYYAVCEAILGATPGKYYFKLRVRNTNGEPCTWKQACIRTLIRFFEVNPFLLGVLPGAIVIFISKRNQRLGDMAAEHLSFHCDNFIAYNKILRIEFVDNLDEIDMPV